MSHLHDAHEHEHHDTHANGEHTHGYEPDHAPLPCDAAGHEHHHHADGSCCCEQHAKEFHGIDKPMLIRLILSVVLYLAAMLLPLGETAEMILMICAALIAGYDIILGAIKNLLQAKVFDEYFLMSFAAIAAFIIGEFEEAAAVFVLYRIGAFCQSYAIRHSRQRILHLTGDEDLLDQDGKVQNRFITRFARIYTPIILALAILIAVLLPVLRIKTWHDGIYEALTFLVLACPCAIVISVPLAYFAGIGAASKREIYFHDSAAVDAAAANSIQENELVTSEFDGKTASLYEITTPGGEKTRLVLSGPEKLKLAAAIARKTRLVALENVWFTIVIKLAVLILSVCGISALWFAVFADSGVTVLVVLNSLRAFYTGKKN